MTKKLVYLSIISSLVGASALSIDLGFFQLSLFRILIFLITVTMIAELLWNNKKILIRSKTENSFSIKFMFVWFLYAFASLGWVKDYQYWIKDVYFLAIGLLCVIIFSKYFRDKFDILAAFRWMSLMVIFHNSLGWYEVISGNYLFLSMDRVFDYSRYHYPVSMFGNSNDFATFMFFSIFIIYICIINTKSVILKLFYIATLISSFNLLIMTGSRANILGLVLASIVFIGFSMKKRRTRQNLILILLSVFLLVILRPDILSNLFLIINENIYFKFNEQIGSDGLRLNLIKNGFIFFLKTLGFGTGAGNIKYWMANYGVYYTGPIDTIHNWWMEILTGYGLVIFVMYIIFYIKLFFSILKKMKYSTDKIDISISLGILCCMTGFVVGAISSSSNISREWLWVFWSIAIAYQGMNIKVRR